MHTITSSEFDQHPDRYKAQAMTDTVVVTNYGPDELILLSGREFRRLKRLNRETLAASDLTEAEVAEILASEIPAGYAYHSDDLKS